MLPNTAAYARGPRSNALRLNGHPINVLICYEDLHAGFVRKQVAKTDAELLVNLTNDSWFTSSVVAEWHLALAKLRAVEHRRYLVRATNNGVSAVVDPTGRVVARAEHGRAVGLTAKVGWRRSPPTAYAKQARALVCVVVAAFAMSVFPPVPTGSFR